MSEGFVYRWHDDSNGKCYIGSHKGTTDDGYIGSGTWFKKAYAKRPESFTREIMYKGVHYREYEQIILDYEDAASSDYFYNLKNAAEGGYTLNGRPMSKEGRENLSKSKLGNKNPMYGVKITDSHRSKLSDSRRGSKNPAAIKVYCEYLDKEFETLKDAAIELRLSKAQCSRMINGTRNNKYGLRKI